VTFGFVDRLGYVELGFKPFSGDRATRRSAGVCGACCPRRLVAIPCVKSATARNLSGEDPLNPLHSLVADFCELPL
jgi:hypothetical protein